MTQRRLGAIGTLVWDRILHPSTAGEPVEQWGGMLYSLSALAATRPDDWSVEPVLKLGSDMAESAVGELNRLGLELTGPAIRPVPERMNRVELTYTDTHHRGERLTGGVPSWEWAELEPLLQRYDALYINFISGFELELDTARRVRSSFTGPIYADLHSLFLGCPGAGVRQHRVLPDWERWVACFDVVQLNESELKLLAAGEDQNTFINRVLELGPGMVVTTLGAEGARIDAVAGRLGGVAPGERRSIHVDAADRMEDGDPTGCGDVWGSVFLTGLLDGLELEAAGRRANAMAALNIRTSTTAALHDAIRDASHGSAIS